MILQNLHSQVTMRLAHRMTYMIRDFSPHHLIHPGIELNMMLIYREQGSIRSQ